jgi:hypothetical protein
VSPLPAPHCLINICIFGNPNLVFFIDKKIDNLWSHAFGLEGQIQTGQKRRSWVTFKSVKQA